MSLLHQSVRLETVSSVHQVLIMQHQVSFESLSGAACDEFGASEALIKIIRDNALTRTGTHRALSH